MKLCSVVDCTRNASAKGMCQSHYYRWYRHGDPLAGRAYRSTGGRRCSVDDCERPAVARGWCSTHYGRWYTKGDALADVRIDDRNPGNPELTAVLQGRSIADLAAFCDWVLLDLHGAMVPPAHARDWFARKTP